MRGPAEWVWLEHEPDCIFLDLAPDLPEQRKRELEAKYAHWVGTMWRYVGRRQPYVPPTPPALR